MCVYIYIHIYTYIYKYHIIYYNMIIQSNILTIGRGRRREYALARLRMQTRDRTRMYACPPARPPARLHARRPTYRVRMSSHVKPPFTHLANHTPYQFHTRVLLSHSYALTCTQRCTHTNIHARPHAHMQKPFNITLIMRALTHACTHTRTHTHTHTYARAHAHMPACGNPVMRAYTHIC